MNWQLQDANGHFLDIVEQARTEGPQTVTSGDERVSVVLSAEDYDALRAARGSLVDRLLTQPVSGRDLRPRSQRLPRSLQP